MGEVNHKWRGVVGGAECCSRCSLHRRARSRTTHEYLINGEWKRLRTAPGCDPRPKSERTAA